MARRAPGRWAPPIRERWGGAVGEAEGSTTALLRSSESGPGIIQRRAASDSAARMMTTMPRCQVIGAPEAAIHWPMSAPQTAPSDHAAWKEVMIEDPQRLSTLSPCAFWATSMIASSPPPSARQAASMSQFPAVPAPR